MFRPPSWLASRIAPTAAGFPAGQLRRLRPSRTCVVAFARIGYARRPTTGNWRHEDFHLARFTALSTAPSAAFPPHSPPTMFRLCSNDSSVLCRCPTPRRRTCGPCGLSLLPPSCDSHLAAGVREVSRFSCMKFLGVPGVFDYAGLSRSSRYRACSCCLPRITRTSASGLHLFGAEYPPRLSSVYASLGPSR